MRDAQPGAGADDADRAGRRQRFVGTAQSLEIARVRLRDGMADRLEIIHQHIIVDVQLLPDQRRADDPRIVGEADDLTLRRPRDGDRAAARQAAALLALELLPCGLEARMSLGMQDRKFAKRRSEGSSVGTEWVMTCRSRWWPDHLTK